MLIVQKFGGTSVGDINRIKNVSKKVKLELDKKNKVIDDIKVIENQENLTLRNNISRGRIF